MMTEGRSPTMRHMTWSPKETSHVMSGTVFFVCWTSWISQCFPASIFFQSRKRSVISKRVQESTLKEGSAVAKPRPMNLVSENLLSAKKDPPQDLGDPNSLEKWGIGSEFEGRLMQFQSWSRVWTQMRGENGQSSSLAAKAKTQTDGKIPSKSSSSKGESSSGIRGKILCRNFLRESLRNRHVILGTLPCVLTFKSDKGCNYGDK